MILGLDSGQWQAVGLSLKVSALAVAVSLPPAMLLGWILGRREFRGKVIIETLVTLPLVLPPVVVGYLLLTALGRRGIVGQALEDWFGLRIAFTWWAAALASAVVGFPLLVRSIRLGFAAVDPRLEAIARTLGASRWRAFFGVSIPLAWPAIVSGVVLAFARGWGEFGATIMIAGNIAGQTRTVPLAIYGSLETPGGFASAWPLVILSIVVAWAALLGSEWLARRGARLSVPVR